MAVQDCLLQQVSSVLLRDQGLRAVWLDTDEKKVSFAYQAGINLQDTQSQIEQVVTQYPPEQSRSCLPDKPAGPCQMCRQHGVTLPAGIRIVAMPNAGVMLEKESCVTATRFWKWQQFPWIRETAQGLLKDAHHEDLDEWKHDMTFAGACGVLVLAGFILEKIYGHGSLWSLLCYIPGFIAGAWHPATEAWELLRKKVLDIHFLMLCVAIGAACIGHWWEGGVLLFLFSSSGALEELAMARTKREINSLFKEAPKEATIVNRAGQEERLAVDAIQPGMILRVRPGEQFAVDARVLKGSTAVNEANLTGESIPVDKAANDEVFSGTINLWGTVDCRAARAVSESSLAKIIKLIQEAQESKAPSQRFTDKFSSGYTYLILSVCAAMFFVWWLVLGCAPFLDAQGEHSAFYRAMTLLVVASPCALVLSIPSAILAGIAAGARHGVLFRGGAAIEKLAEIKRVALDKTGTLTTGELEVVGIETIPPGHEQELQILAAALGHNSAHPVSRAIAKKFSAEGMPLPAVDNFHSTTGMGVSGTINQQEVHLGRRSMFADESWSAQFAEPEIGVTETLIDAGPLKGRILLRDTVRASSAPLLAELQSDALHVTMLTGDRTEAAEKVASQLGLKEFRARLKPEDKVAAIQAWEQAGERVAMVGDGVNDAPSLAAAHVAVGMGLRGSDAVLEQADVILTQDRLENFKYAYDLSRKASQIIKQNLFISLGVIVVLVTSALGSWLPLTLGVIGHEGSTVVVVLNSLRLLFFNKNNQPS